MTDRERAEQVIRDVHKELPDVWLGGRQRYVLVEAIADLLATVRRETWEEAAKMLETYPNRILYSVDTDLTVLDLAKACRDKAKGDV